MNDPERLLRGSDDSLERELLRSAVADEPPDGAKQRAAAALGLGGASAAIGGAGASGAGVTKGVATAGLAKWLLVGLAAAVVSAAMAASVRYVRAPSEVEPVVSVARVTSKESPAAPASAPLPVAPPATANAPVDEPTTATKAQARTSSIPPLPRAESRSIARQVALLDEARRALREQSPALALGRLAAYDAEFPAGSLGLESTVVKIEALAADHEDARARSVAERFLAEHPDAPQAPHVRALVERIRAGESNP